MQLYYERNLDGAIISNRNSEDVRRVDEQLIHTKRLMNLCLECAMINKLP